ncbi:MAG: hypothetical protein ABIV94_03555 [Acidimicrobiales bacterium]
MPSTRRRHPRPSRRVTAARLATSLTHQALLIEEAFGADVGWDGMNQLVLATVPFDGALDVAFTPVDGDIGEALAGLRAPDDCNVVGVATLGWVRPLGDGGAVGPRGDRVRSVHLLHRSGATASVLHRVGDEVEVVPGPVEGRIPDLLCRALQLPTAPPATTTAELWALHWLGALLAADSGSLQHWGDVARLHPALEGLNEVELLLASAELGPFADLVAAANDWESARLACARGELTVAGVDADLAEWLDEGSFARWVLGAFPPVGALAEAVAAVLPPGVNQQVEAVLAGWGIRPARYRM